MNPSCSALLESDQQTLVGKKLSEFIHPLDSSISTNRLARLEKESGSNEPTEIRIITALGNVKILQVVSRKIQLQSHSTILICATDLTLRSEMELKLKESEQNFRRLFENMTDVYYRTDTQGIVQMVGPGVRHVLGYEPEDIIGNTAEAFYPNPKDRDALKKAIREMGVVTDFPGQMVRKDGKIIDISISSHLLYDENKQFAGVEGIYRDVTERADLQRELHRLATLDPLTEVANRRAFFEQADILFKRCKNNNETMALLILDMDNFKKINDTYGHAMGDNVLIRFVEAANKELKDRDYLARLGGEEFCIILPGRNRQETTDTCQRILEQTRQLRFKSDEAEEFGVTVSIGATFYHDEDTKVRFMLVRADKALYQAKSQGRNRTVLLE